MSTPTFKCPFCKETISLDAYSSSEFNRSTYYCGSNHDGKGTMRFDAGELLAMYLNKGWIKFPNPFMEWAVENGYEHNLDAGKQVWEKLHPGTVWSDQFTPQAPSPVPEETKYNDTPDDYKLWLGAYPHTMGREKEYKFLCQHRHAHKARGLSEETLTELINSAHEARPFSEEKATEPSPADDFKSPEVKFNGHRLDYGKYLNTHALADTTRTREEYCKEFWKKHPKAKFIPWVGLGKESIAVKPPKKARAPTQFNGTTEDYRLWLGAWASTPENLAEYKDRCSKRGVTGPILPNTVMKVHRASEYTNAQKWANTTCSRATCKNKVQVGGAYCSPACELIDQGKGQEWLGRMIG